MRRAALVLAAAALLSACGEEATGPAGPTAGELLGVPRGVDLFQSRSDAEEFDGHVDTYAGMSCTTLRSTVAALEARDQSRPSTTRRVATIGGALIPGPAGTLTRVIGSELAASSAARGNLRLAAAEAVRAAKDC